MAEINNSPLVIDISIIDVIEFIQASWKLLLCAGVVGAVLGMASWVISPSYKAELILQNNDSFNITSWRYVEKIFPALASEMLEKKLVPDDQIALFKKITSPIWWSKNVQVNFALTKNEAKDLIAMTRDSKIPSTSILSFSIIISAPSEAKALDEIRDVVKLIRNGGAYIDVRKLLNDYETMSLVQWASIQEKISASQIELAYLKERAKNLEFLKKSYPSTTHLSDQFLIEPKDSGAKFLPLSAQIIGINNEIYATKEGLERLNDQLNKIKIHKVYLEGAAPLIAGRYDGIAMIKDLLAFEERLRAKTAPGNIKALHSLDAIRNQLLNIEVKYSNNLSQNISPTIVKNSDMSKNAMFGFLIISFAMLAILLLRCTLRSLRSQIDQQKSTLQR